jgi:hypothetical protein
MACDRATRPLCTGLEKKDGVVYDGGNRFIRELRPWISDSVSGGHETAGVRT